MDLGTGKDLKEYQTEKGKVPYHLIDIAEAGSQYNVYQYQQDFLKVYLDLKDRGVFPVMLYSIEKLLRKPHLHLHQHQLKLLTG